MSTIRLSRYPMVVIGPNTNLRKARVFVTDTHAWIITWENDIPLIANHFPVVEVRTTERRSRATMVIDDQGNEWVMSPGGSCGCGDPGKRFDAAAWLAQQGVAV